LKDTKEVLDEISSTEPIFTICIPTQIYNTIILPPEQKFQELPSVVGEWFDEEKNNVRNIDLRSRENYVFLMRDLLDRYRPVPITNLVDDVKKIGKDSIYRDDVIKKFGSIGKTLFEILTVSSERNATIIGFGEKTISFIRQLGSVIKKGKSKFKERIKSIRGIGSALVFMHFFMDMDKVNQFLQDFQISELPLTTTEIITLGLLIIGNG
jgi:hypothetical protein